mmetsp:Transcript_57638/g.166908  ORF Transcript_57638/g.166908 Transcript_57638/m.166908 type:complete len:244 (+) Transcript_57638:74-805(+)
MGDDVGAGEDAQPAVAAAVPAGAGNSSAEGIRLPRLVVFDLDNCCWSPEMYQLNSGAPFAYNPADNTCACAGRGRRGGGELVHLLGDVAEIWGCLRNRAGLPLSAYCHTSAGGPFGGAVFDPEQTKICIASCCDEPDWARDLLGKFRVVHLEPKAGGGHRKAFGETMAEAVAFTQITYGNKTEHHRAIQRASGGVDFRDMVFFDDRHGHVRDVAGLGVTAVCTPHGGVTWRSFLEALRQFQRQ